MTAVRLPARHAARILEGLGEAADARRRAAGGECADCAACEPGLRCDRHLADVARAVWYEDARDDLRARLRATGRRLPGPLARWWDDGGAVEVLHRLSDKIDGLAAGIEARLR